MHIQVNNYDDFKAVMNELKLGGVCFFAPSTGVAYLYGLDPATAVVVVANLFSNGPDGPQITTDFPTAVALTSTLEASG